MIRLGLMPPFTGIVSIYGPEIMRAGRIACQQVNDSGGVLGQQLELIVEDDGSLPEKAVAAANKLIDLHHCSAIIGNLLSNSRIAVAYRVAEPRRIPYLNFSFYEGSIRSRYFFHFAALPNQQIHRMIPHMVDKHGPRLFFAGNNYEWPRGSINAAKTALNNSGGIAVGEEYLPIGVRDEDIEALLDQVADASPDVFVPYFAGSDQISLLTKFTEKGLKKRMAVVMGHYDEMMASQLSPEVREGFFSSNTYFMTIDNAQNREYLSQLSKLPDVTGIWPDGNGILTNFGEGAYVCVKAYAQAVNIAGTLDPEAVIDALSTIAIQAPQGRVVMHPEHHHATVNTYLSRCNSIGKFEIVKNFGAIAPELPDRYRHQKITGLSLEDDLRLQARMLEQMSEAVLLVNTHDGTILYTNTSAEHMFGYGKSELVGLSTLCGVDSMAVSPQNLSTGVVSHLHQKGEWQGELQNQKKDGSAFWSSATITTFTHPAHGEVWLVVHRDITEQKSIETSMRIKDAAIDSSINAVAMAGLDGKLFYINQSFVDLWKLPSIEYAIGKSPLDFWKRPEEAEKVIQAVMENGHWQGEMTAQRHDGSVALLQLSAHMVHEAGGKPLCLMGTFIDISARKQAEQELQRERDFATNLVNTAPIIVLLLDKDGRIKFTNPYFEQLTGYTFAEIKNKDWFSTFLPDSFHISIRDLFHQILENQSADGNINPIVTRNSGKRQIEWYNRVMYDMEGDISGVLAVGLDVTERIQTVEALRQSEARYRRAERGTNDGLWEWNMTTGEDYFSPRWLAMLGYVPNELPYHVDTFISLIHQNDKATVMEILDQHINVGRPYDVEMRLRHKNGTYIWVRARGQVEYDDNGKPSIMAGSIIDITENKLAQTELLRHREHLEDLVAERTQELRTAQDELVLKERLATLGQLTATVSHELRNPLGAIRPSLYLIEKKCDPDNQPVQLALQRVIRNVKRCDHIIDELLDFTRITKLNKQLSPLNTWLTGVIEEQNIHKDIITDLQFSSENIEVAMDPDRLRRAVINVVENACHAMLNERQEIISDKPLLTIATRKSDQRIEIIVTDTGIGMPKDVLQKIFEPFYSTKGFGVGLGMPTVKQIMEQHGGGIEIESAEKQGTSTTLWLPLSTESAIAFSGEEQSKLN